jgi:hypothetical protein
LHDPKPKKNKKLLLAGAFGAIYRRRPHAKGAKAPSTPRGKKEGGRVIVSEIIVNRMNLEIQR